MYEFEQEVQEKKKLAQNNRHRTGQGNRHGGAFKRRELTDKEIEERHGKVMEYKIGQPISWAEFRSYPREMQQEWVNAFAKRFGCGGKGIAIATGTSQAAVSNYLEFANLTLPDGIGRYTDKKGEAIRAWVELPEPAPVEVVEPKPKRAEPEPPKKPELPYFVNTIQSGTMGLEGNATEIFHTLFGIFRDAQLKLDIYFTVVPPEPTKELPLEPEGGEPIIPVPDVDEPTDQGKVNLNKCSFNDLRKIGVSPNIAANIIQTRPFQTVDDLSRVAGINKSFFNILREKVTVYDGA